ncbi:MAG: hypothetical protein Q7U16_02585 [Agitococcus sp.]|nr:hypothetical protein [Agitococcus sp.]
MARNKLIVEDDNDKYILNALIKHIHLANAVEIANPIPIDYLTGSLDSNPDSPTTLIRNLKKLERDIELGNVDKIGIIFDLDTSTPKQRLEMINNALRQSYNAESSITKINEFITLKVKDETIQIACHFININGLGEIEDLLKAIKAKDSDFADCIVDGWSPCLSAKGKNVSPKDLVKFWLDIYRRNDILTSEERRQAGKNTKWDKFLELHPESFDFNSNITELDDLKKFLNLFAQSPTQTPMTTPH